jgi:cytochrome bd-type quinol oxidase subunit 2
MELYLASVVMLLTIAAAVYTQAQLAKHISNSAQRWVVRTSLIAIGIGFAWVSNSTYQPSGALQLIVCITAFCVTHVPSACILYLKRKRAAQR